MPETLPELNNILYSGALSYGKWGRLFEKAIGEYINNRNIAAVNSYNSAMLMALAVIGAKPGDEIIASPMSCLASNQPFATQSVKVVWADIDPETGSLDPRSVESRITKKTKAIFHNHFCGYPGYIDEINKIGRDNGLIVIDDAIEAFGSEYRNVIIGNSGADITVFSFQTVRLPNTIDGGALAFRDAELYEKALLIRDYGIDRKHFRDKDGEISADCDISLPGFGATLSEVNSYIGLMQMNEISHLLSLQRNNGNKWAVYFENNHPGKIRQIGRQDTHPNYWVYGILCDNKSEMLKFFRDKGFYASGVHLNNNHYSVFDNKEELKGVSKFYNSYLALPCGWWFDMNL